MVQYDDSLPIRITKADKTDFKDTCEQFQIHPANMLREMIAAFNDGRLTIKIPKTQMLTLKGVHHVD